MVDMAMAGEAAMGTPVDAAIAEGEATGTTADAVMAEGADKPTTADAGTAEGEAITVGAAMRTPIGVATITIAATVMAAATAGGISEALTVLATDITVPRMHTDITVPRIPTGILTRPVIVIRPATTITGVAGFRIPAALCLTVTNLAWNKG
jgi:hypothetical protein